MNIDLLFTGQGEAGLVCDAGFDAAVAGVMYDAGSGQLTLEFSDASSVDLNIPVEEEVGQNLLNALEIQVGVIERGMVAENRQVPLVLLHDPFGGGNAGHFPIKPRNSVMAFESFMKRCVSGQPVHRDDLGDEESSGTILGGMSAAVLQFAPHLARQRNLEAAPQYTVAPQAPGMSPSGRGGTGTGPPVRRGIPQGGRGSGGYDSGGGDQGNVMRKIRKGGGNERTRMEREDEEE